MKYAFAAAIGLLLFSGTYAQRISASDLKEIKKSEDSLKKYGPAILMGINSIDRLQADSMFTRLLARSLKTKNSFYYPYDSLFTTSILYAPDSIFRIFTWQLPVNDDLIRQHGAIQMRTADGSLKLFPLIDKSDIMEKPEDSIGNHNGWYGAVYYKIMKNEFQNRTFYSLLGYDENNFRSNKKLIEILEIVDGEPVFGARIFRFPNNELKASSPARYIMEFKAGSSPRLTFDKDLNMIIVEHLVSESNQPNKKYTMVGDGDYEGFTWKQGRWQYINKVFNQVTPDGQAPLPKPIRDDKGNFIEEGKLNQ